MREIFVEWLSQVRDQDKYSRNLPSADSCGFLLIVYLWGCSYTKVMQIVK